MKKSILQYLIKLGKFTLTALINGGLLYGILFVVEIIHYATGFGYIESPIYLLKYVDCVYLMALIQGLSVKDLSELSFVTEKHKSEF